MPSLRHLAAAALAACLVAAAPAPASAAPAWRGVQITKVLPGMDPAYIDDQLDLAKRLHLNTVRSEVEWSLLEPDVKGAYDQALLGTVDHLVAAATARGLKPTLLVEVTPCWASAYAAKDCASAKSRETAGTYPPAQPSDYADVVGFLTARYAGKLAAIEVWNEPDHADEFYFAGRDKPQRYAALLKAAHAAIKAADPGTLVLGGSLVGANGNFLRALYEEGIKGHYDALSVHYYDLVLASLRAIRQVQRAHGDTKPLWLGEFGWTSCAPKLRRQGGHTCVTPARQGANLVDIFRALHGTSWVSGAIVFGLYDTRQYDFGLTDEAFKPKRSFTRLADALPAPRGRGRISLRIRRSGGSVYAVGSGPAGDAYELNVFSGSSLRYKATFRLDRHNRFRLKLPPSLAVGGNRVKVWQYWLGRRGASERI